MENKIVLTVVINEDINGNSSSTFISVYTYGTCGEGEHRWEQLNGNRKTIL